MYDDNPALRACFARRYDRAFQYYWPLRGRLGGFRKNISGNSALSRGVTTAKKSTNASLLKGKIERKSIMHPAENLVMTRLLLSIDNKRLRHRLPPESIFMHFPPVPKSVDLRIV